MKYVTKTGRAIGEGRVTRASKLIRKRPRGMVGRPLPLEVSCHPMRMSPTPVNPDCVTLATHYGAGARMAAQYTRKDMVAGEYLAKQGKYAVECSINGIVGYTDDPVFGLAYTRAAEVLGFLFSLIEVN